METSVMIVMAIIYVLVAVLWAIWWVLTLMRQAKKRQWVWFIICLLLPFMIIIYGLFRLMGLV